MQQARPDDLQKNNALRLPAVLRFLLACAAANAQSAATLPPGLYTALLAGQNNGTGIGLVEVYDRGGTP